MPAVDAVPPADGVPPAHGVQPQYTERVRVLWGRSPPSTTRRSGAALVWKHFAVEEDRSALGWFRVKALCNDAHCPLYSGPPRGPAAPGPCSCGVVHDGTGHDGEHGEWRPDELDLQVFSCDGLPVLLHEEAHAFVQSVALRFNAHPTRVDWRTESCVLLEYAEQCPETGSPAADAPAAGGAARGDTAGAELAQAEAPAQEAASADDSDDSSSSFAHDNCWCDGHSNRIVQLLAEWLDCMKRAHGLRVRVRVPDGDNPPPSTWYRPLPGLPAPPQGLPAPLELSALRARETGLLRPFGCARTNPRPFKQTRAKTV